MGAPKKPLIGITMGDPVGIGPEVLVKALASGALREICSSVIFGDTGILQRALAATGVSLALHERVDVQPETVSDDSAVCVVRLSRLSLRDAPYGKPTPKTGKAMVDYILTAVRLAMQGKIDAMVTGPINKAAMTLAGFAYPGHTELLAEETKASNFAMMLAGERLRVVLVTIHHALRRVPFLLSVENVLSTIRLSHSTIKEFFGIRHPSVAVCALNPHAGESGMFGDEETAVINPAIEQARREGIQAAGPLPADSLFYHAAQGAYDVVVCMYHDQGLIPLKLLHFDDAVNVTLGLPIIRTSVDHGTAYDIAGTGKANPKSMINAVKLAAHMVECRRRVGY